jgi:hypothetical protein
MILHIIFMEYTQNIETDIFEKDNMIYLKGDELPQFIYDKSQLCMAYINNKYEFDYIVRTNISTFWNIPLFFTYMNSMPRQKMFTGFLQFSSFISGTGIIMSRDVSQFFICQQKDNVPFDDVNISNKIQRYCAITPITTYCMCFLINCKNEIPENIDNILYFRIKNSDDRTNDVICFKILLNKIYSIMVE